MQVPGRYHLGCSNSLSSCRFVCARDSFRYQFAASFTRAYLCFPGLQGDIDHESGKLKGM